MTPGTRELRLWPNAVTYLSKANRPFDLLVSPAWVPIFSSWPQKVITLCLPYGYLRLDLWTLTCWLTRVKFSALDPPKGSSNFLQTLSCWHQAVLHTFCRGVGKATFCFRLACGGLQAPGSSVGGAVPSSVRPPAGPETPGGGGGLVGRRWVLKGVTRGTIRDHMDGKNMGLHCPLHGVTTREATQIDEINPTWVSSFLVGPSQKWLWFPIGFAVKPTRTGVPSKRHARMCAWKHRGLVDGWRIQILVNRWFSMYPLEA